MKGVWGQRSGRQKAPVEVGIGICTVLVLVPVLVLILGFTFLGRSGAESRALDTELRFRERPSIRAFGALDR